MNRSIMTINWVLLCSTEPSFLCEENFKHGMHSGRYTVQIILIDVIKFTYVQMNMQQQEEAGKETNRIVCMVNS